jgi:hypothetical protein
MDLLADRDGNPILHQLCEEGFVDLTFKIRNLVKEDRHYRFQLVASYDDCKVGMDVLLVKGIQGGFDSNMELVKKHVYREGVYFIRSGLESDRLIAALGELYGAPTTPCKMIDKETFTAIALHQGSLDMENEPVKLKLFGRDFEPFDENAYYESFFNIDLVNGFVYWNEKDPDYRRPLLEALTVK